MQRALQLALNGLGNVAPNPLVGAVVVHDDNIIGEGFHEVFGGPHAEVNAINAVKDKSLLPASTLYVTLEPCNHFGKTPPCCDLILKHQIKTVVICNSDPNPLVKGAGIDRLKANGVEVITEILKFHGEYLNRRFFTFHRKKRPFIILKWAQTQDGFIDKLRTTGEKKINFITNEHSQRLAHKWRTEEPAILVGKNTVRNDDPQLTARLWNGKNPLRIVLDRNLETDPASKVYNQEAHTLVFNSKKESKENNIQYHQLSDFSLDEIMKYLYSHQIQSVIVEGGAKTLQSFIDQSLWDEARVFTSPVKWGDGLKAPFFEFESEETTNDTGDELNIFYNK